MAGHRKAGGGGECVQRGLKGKWAHSFGGAGGGGGSQFKTALPLNGSRILRKSQLPVATFLPQVEYHHHGDL